MMMMTTTTSKKLANWTVNRFLSKWFVLLMGIDCVLFLLAGEASVALSASGSASLGSASQLFIRGPESDREDCESSSQLGLAGSIASRRLEVHAEVSASPKRSTFVSETTSATVSLSEKSTTLSMADDGAASTRALAGSLLSYKVCAGLLLLLLIVLIYFKCGWLVSDARCGAVRTIR